MANIELPATDKQSDISYDDIAGRTIQPDGSIVPFTGKPYEKLVGKGKGFQVKAKVFTLPGAQVCSILEYRYRRRFGDRFQDPSWFVQTRFYVLKEHFLWKPTEERLTDYAGGKVTSGVAWVPFLPSGVNVVTARKHGYNEVTLDVLNVAPRPAEEHTPPVDSLGYRVLFYYTGYKTEGEFWTGAGKVWSASWDRFIGPGTLVKLTTEALLAPGDNADTKLTKIYGAVTALENTDYVRTMEGKESKNAGFKAVDTTDDVLRMKRGSDRQLAALFVSMARAAGFKAYLMGVASRSERIFLQRDLNMQQLDDLIAIVLVDGKEQFFDPGTLFCQFRHLSWQHASAGGLRQTESGTEFFTTPSQKFADNNIARIAEFRVAPDGQASGPVTLTYTGDPALSWRQRSARGDELSLKADLRADLEAMLPPGMDVTVKSIENLKEREKPLKIVYTVSGPVGTSTGKRLILPADLFEVNAKPVFSAPQRELPVDLRYGTAIQDAVRYTVPVGMVFESLPKASAQRLETYASLVTSTLAPAADHSGPQSATFRRNFNLSRYIYSPKDYPALRAFYGAVASSAQEVFVLSREVQ